LGIYHPQSAKSIVRPTGFVMRQKSYVDRAFGCAFCAIASVQPLNG